MDGSPDIYDSCPSSGLLPIEGPDAEVLILGSFPSRQSLTRQEYYGNPQNHFWRIMENLLGIERGLPYENRTSLLTGHKIALWDVIRSCCREGSADDRIRKPVYNDIPGFVSVHPFLKLIVLNGTTAGRSVAGIALPRPVSHIILPSTSPANTRFTISEKVRQWEVIVRDSGNRSGIR